MPTLRRLEPAIVTSDDSTDRWLSLSEASELLGVHASTLRRWSDSGRVACRRTPGGHRRFSLRKLQPLLDSEERLPEDLDPGRAEDQSWHDRFDDAGLIDDLRALGQRLGGLVMQFVIRGDDDPRYLAEGGELGEEYGRKSRAAGIDLIDAVGAFSYYRATFTDTLAGSLSADAHAARAYGRYDAFMSRVLLGLISGYQAHPNGSGKRQR